MVIGAYAICYPPGITKPRQATNSGWISGGDGTFPLGDVFAKDGALARYPSARLWDSGAQQPYLSLPKKSKSDAHCGQASQYIPYDDEQSIVAKGTWSKQNGYGGTMVWTLQQLRLPDGATGGRSRTALLKALHDGFLMS